MKQILNRANLVFALGLTFLSMPVSAALGPGIEFCNQDPSDCGLLNQVQCNAQHAGKITQGQCNDQHASTATTKSC